MDKTQPPPPPLQKAPDKPQSPKEPAWIKGTASPTKKG
jgi:hypothetical protein